MTAAIKDLQDRLAKLEAAGVGKPGQDGSTGKNGVGVKSATVNAAGNLVLTLTDGRTVDAGKVKGDKGDAGDNGKPGAGIDPAELAALKQRLDSLSKIKIPVQILSPDGRVIDEDFYPLGKDGTFKPIKLRLHPAKK